MASCYIQLFHNDLFTNKILELIDQVTVRFMFRDNVYYKCFQSNTILDAKTKRSRQKLLKTNILDDIEHTPNHYWFYDTVMPLPI